MSQAWEYYEPSTPAASLLEQAHIYPYQNWQALPLKESLHFSDERLHRPRFGTLVSSP